MAERPPSQPRIAWERAVTPRERRSPQQPDEVSMVQLWNINDEGLSVDNDQQEAMDFIQAFASCPDEYEDQKIEFLDGICMLCRMTDPHNMQQSLDAFCHTNNLPEKIKALLEKEPWDQLSTEVRWKAMLAIARLSSIESVLAGKEKSLLEACFSKVFFLPPRVEMRGLTIDLYVWTLDAMDTMLEKLVLNCSVNRVGELVQSIFQMLLNFTDSPTLIARVRALETIRTLSHFLVNHPTLEAWEPLEGGVYFPIYCDDLQIPILGQVLGRLLLFYSSKEETSLPALDALFALSKLIHKQKSRSPAKEKIQKFHWVTERPSHMYLPTVGDFAMDFAKYLTPCETTDVVLVAIEAMRDCSIFEKEAASNVLELFLRFPDIWLEDVPEIMNCIHKHLKCINTEKAQRSVQLLLVTLTDQDPNRVITSLLKISPPGDSSGTAMWEAMISVPQPLEKILKELLGQLQGRKSVHLVESTAQSACLLHLAMMASNEFQSENFGNTYQRRPSLITSSLLLRCLIPLSKRPDMARKMQVFLPLMGKFLEDGDTDVKTAALILFQKVFGHLERKEASAIALQLAEEKLLSLFDSESSQLREVSISFFRDLVKSVVGRDKKAMKKKVQRTLLPLFFHTQDKTDSVSKASREALLAVVELLKWKKLKDLVQPQQMWRTVDYSLLQDGSRLEGYLQQSLPYLKNAQATLREAAVRFIGLGARRLRDQDEMLQDICIGLRSAVYDTEPSIQCLAAQTLLILETPRRQPASRWWQSLPALCCWPC